MPWVRLDDQFPNHPKVVGIGPLGIALQVAGLCYSSRYLTDGFVPAAAIPTLLDFSELDEHAFEGRGSVCWMAVAKLTQAGIWAECSGGYTIHDYLVYQPSRAQVLKERIDARERMQRLRSLNVRPNFGNVQEKFTTPVPVPVPIEKDKNPSLRETGSKRKRREPKDQPREVGISEEFRRGMIQRFSAPLAPRSVNEEIERALSHKAAKNYAYPQEAYVRGWLGREVKTVGAGLKPATNGHQGGLIPAVPMPEGWKPETEEEAHVRIKARLDEVLAEKGRRNGAHGQDAIGG